MDKSSRELIRLANDLGLTHVTLAAGGRHRRLVGVLDGERFELPVSITKAWATPRGRATTTLNLKRAITAQRERRILEDFKADLATQKSQLATPRRTFIQDHNEV